MFDAGNMPKLYVGGESCVEWLSWVTQIAPGLRNKGEEYKRRTNVDTPCMLLAISYR